MKALFLVLFSCFLFGQSKVSDAEKNALLSLYHSTDGARWATVWDLSHDPEYWYGVTVERGAVTALTLNGNNLSGTLPALSGLSKLRQLDLSDNHLTGTISSVSLLSGLESLILTNNSLEGDLGGLSSSLSKITKLGLGNNRFSMAGAEDFFTSMQRLVYLDLSGVEMNEIPASVSSLKNLSEFRLANMKHIGGFGNLASLSQLLILDLSGNQLTEVPQYLVSLPNLLQLDLSGNLLSSDKVGALASCKKLQWLSLRNNQLSAIPSEIRQLTELVHLNLGENQITENNEVFNSLKFLQQLWLDGNALKGSFPDLGNLKSLMMLSVAGNQLTGNLPEKLPEVVDISNNRFSASLVEDFVMTLDGADRRALVTYSPQRYDEIESIGAPVGSGVRLPQSLSASDGYAFTWFKNLEQNTGVTSENYTISRVSEADYSSYTCEAYLLRSDLEDVFEISLFREPVILTESLATDSPQLKEISIFPNPASDFIQVQTRNVQTGKIRIYDGAGRLVYDGNERRIDVSSLPQGFYILTVFTEQEGVKSFKFIKK